MYITPDYHAVKLSKYANNKYVSVMSCCYTNGWDLSVSHFDTTTMRTISPTVHSHRSNTFKWPNQPPGVHHKQLRAPNMSVSCYNAHSMLFPSVVGAVWFTVSAAMTVCRYLQLHAVADALYRRT